MIRQQTDEWFSDPDGNQARRYEYPITPDSVCFDLGGFEGEWALRLNAKFGCAVHVFEPVEQFAHIIQRAAGANPKIHVHAFGLGPRTERVRMHMAGNGTSVAGADPDGDAQIVSIADFMRDQGIAEVDLTKINIEGAEYDLVDHMLATGLMPKFNHLQVQFHKEVENAEARLMACRAGLARTHEQKWNFDFVFESHSRK
jgi:FkbM family methyltransferase